MHALFKQKLLLTITQKDKFDITGPAIAQRFPPKWAAGYLNDAETQQALGVPLNWTGNSVSIAVGKYRPLHPYPHPKLTV